MVPKDKLSLDLEQVETVYLATLAFLNTNIQGKFIAMAWGFDLTNENFDRFIKPWHKGLPLSFSAWCDAERDEKREVLKNAKDKADYFFLITHSMNLRATSFQVLKSEFLRWSIPIAMEIFEKLSRLVDPDLYREMLQILRSEAKQS